MTVAEWAQRLERDTRIVAPVRLEWADAAKLAALLRRAERVEEAARVVAVPEPGCPCPGCAAMIALREALEGGK